MTQKNTAVASVRRSQLFRHNFTAAASVILISFMLMGITLLIFLSYFWATECLGQLENAVSSVATSAANATSLDDTDAIICSALRQTSNVLNADVFITDVDGRVSMCKEILQPNFTVRRGTCIAHSRYTLSDETVKKCSASVYSGTGTLDGCLNKVSLIAAAPVIRDGQVLGIVFATMDRSGVLASQIISLGRALAAAMLLVMFITFICVYAISARTVKTLKLMSDAVKKYSEGDFSERIPVRMRALTNERDEIDDLVSSFNTMAQALSVLETSRRSFVANVSHELKTPMTTISGFIDGILDGTIPPEKQSTYLTTVSDEVKRLSRLVVAMLNMSRIESGETTVNPVVFDISEMLMKTLFSFEQIIESKKIDIRGLENITQNNVNADRDMINQVVYNLIDNAVKFTDEGGYIEIKSENRDGRAVITVCNSGRGLSSEETTKIFERFYKVDRSRSYDVKGAGMGLYIVKSLVEMHGGHIAADGEPGKYARFVFDLPEA